MSVISDNPLTLPPCSSVYGDSAEVVYSSELLAALNGGVIGWPPFITFNGAVACDNSAPNCGGDQACRTANMIALPTAAVGTASPSVTDVHMRPCIASGVNSTCNNLTAPDSDIIGAQTAGIDAFNAVWSLLENWGISGNTVMFGETWSNSLLACNAPPNQPVYRDDVLTSVMIAAYSQSQLFASHASSTVFRPWGNANAPNTGTCETPLNIGAPNGPFKY